MTYTSYFNPFSLYGPTTGVGFEVTCGSGGTSNGVSYIGAYNQYEMPDLSESDAGTLGFCKNLKQYLIWAGSEWIDQYQNTIETHEKEIGPNHLVFTSNTNGSTVCIKSYVISETFGETPNYHDYYENIDDGIVNDPKTKYSLDDGVTFNVYNGEVFTLDKNKSVHFIAQGDNFCHADMLYFGLSFVVEGDVSVSGNLYDSLKENGNSIEPDKQKGGYYCFSLLFTHCNGLTDASQLVLPHVLGEGMFGGMFAGCTSLTTAPELPATTLANRCYAYMFSNCTSLATAPELPATELANRCYTYMFSNCTSLATAPELPATELADYCYSYMFEDCTGLTQAPELPATTLAENCYSGMFGDCTSLTTAPELPATELANNCYDSMFYGCTGLTTAPELPATELVDYCYENMFSGCTSLNTITCLATDISADGCTQGWLENVDSSGTFTKAASMNDWQTGADGIPENWTVIDAE